MKFVSTLVGGSASLVLFRVIRIDTRIKLSAVDEVLEIAGDGAAGDFEFTGELGNVGLGFNRVAQPLQQFMLPREAFGELAFWLTRANHLGTFE